ncbi:unnamed protein product [Musa acuminata subsp. burmannicoides]
MLRHLLLLQRLRRPLQHLRVRLRRRRRMRSRRARAASPPGGVSHPLRQPNGEGQSLGQAEAPPRPEPTALRRQLRRQHQRAHRLQLQERMDGEDHPVQPEGLHLRGLEGLNYLTAGTDGENPTVDPRVPGKQQSVISFTKKGTPGINIVKGEGFPTRLYFDGEECALPDEIP